MVGFQAFTDQQEDDESGTDKIPEKEVVGPFLQ